MQLYYAPLDAYREADKLPRLDRLAAYAALNRYNALYMIQKAGSGHIGSSFSSMEIITWMHLEHPEIAFFSSKGHDAPAFYASLIATGRLPFDTLHSLRRVGGLPGHPELRTPGMVAHSGSLGMGISKAKGLIRANRLRGVKQRVCVLVGDGELQEGQNWEALRDCDLEELAVIVDNNGLSTERAATVPRWLVPDFVIDGHDHSELEQVIQRTGLPLLIFADTVKGKGVSFIEGNPKYHSGAISSDEYQAAIKELGDQILRYIPSFWPIGTAIKTKPKPPGLIPAYASALDDEGVRTPSLVVLDADLAEDCGLVPFRARFPERFIECGIAEQDMVSQAGMLAAQGFVPIVHSFAAFLTRRANEQIYDNCHQDLKVIYVGTLAGRLPDGPGPTHEALQDVALMRTMPGMEIYEPATAEEVAGVLHYAVHQAEGPVYIRLVANPIERSRLR